MSNDSRSGSNPSRHHTARGHLIRAVPRPSERSPAGAGCWKHQNPAFACWHSPVRSHPFPVPGFDRRPRSLSPPTASGGNADSSGASFHSFYLSAHGEPVIFSPLGLSQWFNGFCTTTPNSREIRVKQKPLNHRRKVGGEIITRTDCSSRTFLRGSWSCFLCLVVPATVSH